MPTEAETKRAIDSDEPLREVVAQMCNQLHELQGRVTQLEVQHGAAALYMPRNDIPLNRREIDEVLKENPQHWFEAVDDYFRAGLRINKGKLFCAQHYANLPAHVSAGLKIVGTCPPA